MQRTAFSILGAAALLLGGLAGPALAAGNVERARTVYPGLAEAAQALGALEADRRLLAIEVAQVQQLPQNYAAQVEVRLQALERRLQDLTGEMEELQHRARQVDGRLDRAIADIEFRLNQLEGGPAGSDATGQAAPFGPTAADETAEGPGTPSAPPPGRRPGQAPAGGSMDPQTFADGTGTLGTLTFRTPAGSPGFAGPTRLAPDADTNSPSPGPASDPLGATAALPGGSPADAYQAAYRLLQRGDYSAAEAALQQFLATHGDDALASNAHYWLGETYYVRGRYEDAASAFARGYQRFPDGAKAVDNLLKLGISLARLDRRDDACVALTRIPAEFPNGPIAIQRRAESEAEELGCP